MSTHVRSQEEIAARVKALESILIEKGIMTTAAVSKVGTLPTCWMPKP